jgi:hypothetical protein
VAHQPEPVLRLLTSLLAKDRAHRPQSAWDLRQALLEVIASFPPLRFDLASEVRAAHAHLQAAKQEGAFQVVFSAGQAAATVSSPELASGPLTPPPSRALVSPPLRSAAASRPLRSGTVPAYRVRPPARAAQEPQRQSGPCVSRPQQS